MRIFLGLCSNLLDRDMNLVNARDLLLKHDVLTVGQSEVLETEPLGGLDQPMYLNQVIECRTDLSPEELLKVCKAVETEMGRPSKKMSIGNISFGASSGVEVLEERWESRIIDIDILLYGDVVLDGPLLTIPHSGITERWFVVQGLLDLDAQLVHPRFKKPIRDYL